MSKRIWLFAALAAMLVLLGSSAAFAVPSLGGPTGVVSVPNALIAPMGQVSGAVSWQRLADYQLRTPFTPTALQGEEDVNVWSAQVLGGVSDQVEAWASFATTDDALDSNAWGIGAKWQIVREPDAQATVALGASFQQGSGDAQLGEGLSMYSVDNDIDVTKVYLAVTKDLTPAGLTGEWGTGAKVFGTVGLLWADASVDETITTPDSVDAFDASETLLAPFVGVEFMTLDCTAFGLEYRWKDSDVDEKAVFSAVLRQQFPNGIFGEIGTTNADPLGFGLDSMGLFARVGYTFGLGAP